MWMHDVCCRRPAFLSVCFALAVLLVTVLSPGYSKAPPPPPAVQGTLLPTFSLGTAAAPVAVPVTAQADLPVETRSYNVTAAVAAGVRINALSEDESAEVVRSQIDEQVASCQSFSVQQAQSSKTWTPATLRTDEANRFVDVSAPANAHRDVESLIEIMARSGFGQVSLSVRFMASPKEYLPGQLPWTALNGMPQQKQQDDQRQRTEGVSGRVTVDESLPVLSAVIGPLMTRALVSEHQNDPDGNILFGPKITLRNGFSGTVVSEVVRPFVTGVDLASAQRTPTIETLPDGTRLRLSSEFAPDHNSLRITGEFEMTELLNVSTATAHTFGGPVSVQVPRVRRSTIEFAQTLEVGESLVIQCPPTGDRLGYRHLLITPDLIPLTDAKW